MNCLAGLSRRARLTVAAPRRKRHASLCLALIMALASSILMTRAAAQSSGQQPNIVLILADDLGWSDLGCYGHPGHQTPAIDRLATEGLRFTDAYAAAPVCAPTRASILTGKNPARLHFTAVFDRDGGKRQLLPPDWTNRLALELDTLPERLQRLGYTTAIFGKWHLGPPEEFWPEHQGFDLNIGGWKAGHTPSFYPPYKNPRLPDGPAGEYLTHRLTSEAVTFINTHTETPFFLYLSHLAPHTPLEAPQADVENALGRPGVVNPVYAAMVQSLDRSVADIRRALEEQGIAENTLLLFTSDNGGVHRNLDGVTPITSNAPLRGEKATLYEGGIRVPMIAWWPGVVPAGETSSALVTTDDFLPTFLSLAGAPVNEPDIDGIDLSAYLQGAPAPERDFLAWHYPHYYRKPVSTTPVGAIRSGNWKLLEDYETGALELYDLSRDIGESHNLVNEMPTEAARLQTQLANWRKVVGAQMPLPNPDFVAPGAE